MDTPALSATPAGKRVYNFRLALPRTWVDEHGRTHDKFSYVECSAWGELANNAVDSLYVGAHVVVAGTVRADPRKPDALVITAADIAVSLKRATVYVENANRTVRTIKVKDGVL